MNNFHSPQEEILQSGINRIALHAYEHLEDLTQLSQDESFRIAGLILEFCCKSQHTAGIMVGRKAFARLPQSWLSLNLQLAINSTVDLENPWEYRRLLELLKETKSGLLRHYVALGAVSKVPEVQESALEFTGVWVNQSTDGACEN